jgi:hypothetical protein
MNVRTHSPIPGTARPKTLACCRSLARIACPNLAGGHEWLSPESVVCCQLEVSATGWSRVQGSPTECGVSQLETWVENILERLFSENENILRIFSPKDYSPRIVENFLSNVRFNLPKHLELWRTFQDPIVNVYVPQVYPPNSWQCCRAAVAAQLPAARIT